MASAAAATDSNIVPLVVSSSGEEEVERPFKDRMISFIRGDDLEDNERFYNKIWMSYSTACTGGIALGGTMSAVGGFIKNPALVNTGMAMMFVFLAALSIPPLLLCKSKICAARRDLALGR